MHKEGMKEDVYITDGVRVIGVRRGAGCVPIGGFGDGESRVGRDWDVGLAATQYT